MKRRIAIIGSGFSGLSAAAYLANQGMQVTVFEKNSQPGGRAGKIEEKGFVFDKGPGWYCYPDVYQRFFQQFNKSPQDYYKLDRLNPSYRIYFEKNDYLDIPMDIEELKNLFESVEKGAANKLTRFLENAKYKYELGINKLIYKPSLSTWEFLELWMLASIFRLDLTKSISTYIRSFFTHSRLIQILEFPVLLNGGSPMKTPAIYTLMNYADLVLGTWYPAGGMYTVVSAFYKLALDLGVKFNFNSAVSKIEINENEATGIWVNNEFIEFDIVLATADYHHVENNLLEKKSRSYSDNYWNTRAVAPSAMMFYIGVNRKLNSILHHNLFFDNDFNLQTEQISHQSDRPGKPSFYISCSSKSDRSSAPEGCENLVVFIPVALGMNDDDLTRQKYFALFLDRFQAITGEDIRNDISYMTSYAKNDFLNEYNSFRGTAFGLSNTLRQNAISKPSIKSKKVNNLFYAGQLTNPGTGVPLCIVSGQVAANEILKRI
jgi:phytoene desaturase